MQRTSVTFTETSRSSVSISSPNESALVSGKWACLASRVRRTHPHGKVEHCVVVLPMPARRCEPIHECDQPALAACLRIRRESKQPSQPPHDIRVHENGSRIAVEGEIRGRRVRTHPGEIEQVREVVGGLSTISNLARHRPQERRTPVKSKWPDYGLERGWRLANQKARIWVSSCKLRIHWHDLLGTSALKEHFGGETQPRAGVLRPPWIASEVRSPPRKDTTADRAYECLVEFYAVSWSRYCSRRARRPRAGGRAAIRSPRASAILHATASTSGTTTEFPNCL